MSERANEPICLIFRSAHVNAQGDEKSEGIMNERYAPILRNHTPPWRERGGGTDGGVAGQLAVASEGRKALWSRMTRKMGHQILHTSARAKQAAQTAGQAVSSESK